MSIFDMVAKKATEGRDALFKEVSKFRNASYMEAVVAGAVYIAHADGNISPEEKQKLFGLIEHSEGLQAFSTDDVLKVYNSLMDAYVFDPHVGEAEALKRVTRIKDTPEQAKMVVTGAIVIASSDGVVDEKEKEAVQRLCRELHLSEKDFTFGQ